MKVIYGLYIYKFIGVRIKDSYGFLAPKISFIELLTPIFDFLFVLYLGLSRTPACSIYPPF